MKADVKIVQLTDLMLKLLIEAGEAIVKHVPCKSVVVHRANRGETSMQPRNIYRKGAKILGVGFSLSKCDHTRAVAFQVNQSSDAMTKKFLEYSSHSPYFAKFDPVSVECGGVGCGHLNQFLACIHDGAAVPAEFHSDKDLVTQLDGDSRKLD